MAECSRFFERFVGFKNQFPVVVADELDAGLALGESILLGESSGHQTPVRYGAAITLRQISLLKSSIRPSDLRVQATHQGGRKLNFDSTNQLFIPKMAPWLTSASLKRAVRQNEGLIGPLKWVRCSIAPRTPEWSSCCGTSRDTQSLKHRQCWS
jgi:hypothetical protein